MNACRALAACALWLLLAAVASAHQPLNSIALLDLTEKRLGVELQIPLDQLQLAEPELALPTPTDAQPLELTPQQYTQVVSYLQSRLLLSTHTGQHLVASIETLRLAPLRDTLHLIAKLAFTLPADAQGEPLTLHGDPVLHRVINHRVYLFVRSDSLFGHSDLANAIFPDSPPQAWAVLRHQHTAATLDRSRGSRWRGFTAMLRQGAEHLAEGSDHWLFLLCLLLGAPLANDRCQRWRTAPWRGALGNVIKTVTAFTVGHSITLTLAAVGIVELPSQPIEVLVAASIAIAAGIALQPAWRQRETLVAGGFGLIHGLAFAGTIAELGLERADLLIALIGFNLGIELAQLGIVLAVMPWLLLLSRSRAYAPLVVSCALFAMTAALAWVWERASGGSNPLQPVTDLLTARAPLIYALLASAGCVTGLHASLRQSAKRASPLRQFEQ